MKNIDIRHLKEIIENHGINSIFLDFDGVIGKSIKAICSIFNESYKINMKPQEVQTWKFHELHEKYGVCVPHEDIVKLFDSDQFFDRLEVYEGVIEFMREYREKIIICTKGTVTNIAQKRVFLDELGLNDIHILGVPFQLSKGLINMQLDGNSIFIDDDTTNLKNSNATHKIQFREFPKDTEWNKDWDSLCFDSWI